MIYTTYFAKLKKLPDNVIPVSICAKAPAWYNGIQYKKLAPKYGFFMKWKETNDNDYYIEHFSKEVLEPLNSFDTVDEIYGLLPEDIRELLKIFNCPPWSNPSIHIALVCYEKPEDFCHRHLVAEWLTKNGINTKELNI